MNENPANYEQTSIKSFHWANTNANLLGIV